MTGFDKKLNAYDLLYEYADRVGLVVDFPQSLDDYARAIVRHADELETELHETDQELDRAKARIEQLEKICEIANFTLSVIDEWLGMASTRQAADDSIWRLHRALQQAGWDYKWRGNLEWRGSILKELNDAGFFPNSPNGYQDGARFVYDPTAAIDEPGRVFGNAYGPTIAEVVERMKRAEQLLEDQARATKMESVE